MKSVEVVARSVEEAVQEGLLKLQTTKDEVEIDVIEEGNKGLFGILGSKQAKVILTRKPTINWKKVVVNRFIEELLERMDVRANVNTMVEEDQLRINVDGENLGLLIGRRGQTLDALQYLATLVVNREGGDWVRVLIDIEGYRSRREETLRALARRLASKVVRSGRRVALDPMNAFERRIIHLELQDVEGVETHSEGREPFRRVIILPKRN